MQIVLCRWGAAEQARQAHRSRRLGTWVAELHSVAVPAEVLAATGSYRDFLSGRRNGLKKRLEAWSSLPGARPPHAPLPRLLSRPLAGAAPEFVERRLPADEYPETALVHSDIHANHLLGAGDPWRPAAIIDFGDARSANRSTNSGRL